MPQLKDKYLQPDIDHIVDHINLLIQQVRVYIQDKPFRPVEREYIVNIIRKLIEEQDHAV
jgi:hypothetical protein